MEKGLDVTIFVDTVDLLRENQHDLLGDKLRDHYIDMITEGKFDLVIAAPPCDSFSRALFHDDWGPKRLRDRFSPWGFEGLSGKDLQKAEDGNTLVYFAIQVARAAAACLSKKVGFILEFPEDLGSHVCGTPASIWQFEELRNLNGMKRGAFFPVRGGPCQFPETHGFPDQFGRAVQRQGVPPWVARPAFAG